MLGEWTADRSCVIDIDHSDTTVSGTASTREFAQAAFAILSACVDNGGQGGISRNIGQSWSKTKVLTFTKKRLFVSPSENIKHIPSRKF